MGRWYSELIPPAILLDQPGITVGEYSVALNKSNRDKGEDPYLLAKLLNLPEKPKEFAPGPYGYGLRPPHIEGNIGGYRVRLTTGVKLGNPVVKDVISSEIIVGQLVDFATEHPHLVNRILSKTQTKNQCFHYQFEGQIVYPKIEYDVFKSLRKLYKKYPQLRPENVYDFGTPSGRFCSPKKRYHGLENIGWINENGRYFLDKETFDRIPEGGRLRTKNIGYTDIILTAEVIKTGRWDLLDIESTSEAKESFLDEHPESKQRVNIAVWDAHMSIYAKEKGLSYFDMLHLRAPHDS